ncbi:hypothetical protein [Halorubrum tebenquichense]|uniref:hypothetical protein n=1 Tax=Halorubrum tebenquichense TaxID=119434 RepID=UPI000AFE9E17|nr:hypothetical protein [Halorubrum tebenquichense]
MSVSTVEREVFGDPLAPIDRFVCGLIVAVGAIGHAALAAAIVTFLYAVVSVGL